MLDRVRASSMMNLSTSRLFYGPLQLDSEHRPSVKIWLLNQKWPDFDNDVPNLSQIHHVLGTESLKYVSRSKIMSFMVPDTKLPPLLYNQNRKIKFHPNSYPSDQNAPISKGINHLRQTDFPKTQNYRRNCFCPRQIGH